MSFNKTIAILSTFLTLFIFFPSTVFSQSTFNFSLIASDYTLAGDATNIEIWQQSEDNYLIAATYAADPELSIFSWDGDSLTRVMDAPGALFPDDIARIDSWPSSSIAEDRIIAVSMASGVDSLSIVRWDNSAQTLTELTDSTAIFSSLSLACSVESWETEVAYIRGIYTCDRIIIGGGPLFTSRMRLMRFNENTDTLSVIETGTAFDLFANVEYTILPIPEFWRGGESSVVQEEDYIAIGSGGAQALDAWTDRDSDKAEHLVVVSSGGPLHTSGDFDSISCATTTAGVRVTETTGNNRYFITASLTETTSFEIVDCFGSDLAIKRSKYSEFADLGGASRNAATEDVILDVTLTAGDKVTNIESFALEAVGGRFVVLSYSEVIERIAIRRFREISSAAEFTLVSELNVATGDPNDSNIIQESPNSVLIATVCMTCDGIELYRFQLNSLEATVENKEDETFFRQLYGFLGLRRAQGAGLVMLIIFLAIYLVQGNMAVAGISVAGMFAYFLFVADIGFWTVIPVIFTGIYSLYIRYRSAWE